MDLPIEITTTDYNLVLDLMNAKESRVGWTNSISPGITLRLDRQTLFEAIGTPDIITFTVSIGKDIAVGVFSAWLYDKLKNRASKLKVKDTEVPIDKKAIDQAFTVAVA
jgi:hypothetical protein